MERQLMNSIMGVVDNFMRQDKETRRRVLELLKKHLGHFQSDLDRLLREQRIGEERPRRRQTLDVDLAEENIREQFLLHELFKPPIADRDPEDEDDLI